MRRLLAVALASIGAVVVGNHFACTSFGADSTSADAAAGDAALDGASDAPIGVGTCAASTIVKADFEQGGMLAGGWESRETPDGGLLTIQNVDGGHALHVEVPQIDGELKDSLVKNLPAVPSCSMTFSATLAAGQSSVSQYTEILSLEVLSSPKTQFQLRLLDKELIVVECTNGKENPVNLGTLTKGIPTQVEVQVWFEKPYGMEVRVDGLVRSARAPLVTVPADAPLIGGLAFRAGLSYGAGDGIKNGGGFFMDDVKLATP